ncbi:hypothetical protein EV130_110240 [Rhizobium azibense]|uniref:Uncharacterized protein n=1 Tax=Rhizobium azibense TaxID=1136135 RepID=A0A4V2VAQ1_9HYPH|nr:hypothetical protein EV130_110240 [Rhizobium azibense]
MLRCNIFKPYVLLQTARNFNDLTGHIIHADGDRIEACRVEIRRGNSSALGGSLSRDRGVLSIKIPSIFQGLRPGEPHSVDLTSQGSLATFVVLVLIKDGLHEMVTGRDHTNGQPVVTGHLGDDGSGQSSFSRSRRSMLSVRDARPITSPGCGSATELPGNFKAMNCAHGKSAAVTTIEGNDCLHMLRGKAGG